MPLAPRPLAAAALAVLLLAACGGGGEGETVDSATSAPNDTTQETAAPEAEVADEKLAEIVKTGFGQRDEFVFVTSLVKNLTDEAGATVTVNYSVKDAGGQILSSDSQVEAFSRGGEVLPVGLQVDLPPGTQAASVTADLVVEADGIGTEFPEVAISPVTVETDEFGQPAANFEVTNPTAGPAQGLRVGVVCFDAADNIIGGTSEFPDVPPNGTVRVDTLTLIVSGEPAKCEAYAGAPF